MLRTGFKTAMHTGVMSRARKKGVCGRKAHPTVILTKGVASGPKRKPRQEQAIKWLKRIARRGRLEEFFPIKP